MAIPEPERRMPDEDRWRRTEAIFQAAADLAPELRSEYLSAACGSDVELLVEVESLLKSAQATAGFLATPIHQAAQELAARPAPEGRRIGPYKLLRSLGEGGMGAVFLAARADEHYQRQVAIKLMHAVLGASDSMQARFRAERQILANLDHPNVARLLDGGVTTLDDRPGSQGVPYLVMEFVDGLPIDRYCSQRRRSVRERLQLFLIVCAAVEYAHNNLVVHRDIKPANILVSSSGTPKLLDFGIAKLLDPEFGDETPGRARTTERLMTPEYASPEQIRGQPVTTATDVHGLGVLLYELLTGRRPFRVATRSPLEVALMLCEQEPELPSAAVAGNPDYAANPDAAADARKLKGDLDKIVLMAMRKEPGRRYASVAQLAGDVRAHLEGYPLVARTDRWGYRSQKFVRRHKVGVAAGLAMALALIGFSIAMAILARRATREQAIAQRQAQFLSDMFQASTPDESRGKTITARDLLDRGAQRVDREFAGQPEVRAFLLENIAGAYKSLGVLDQAGNLAERSYQMSAKLHGTGNPATAGPLDLLATVRRLQGEYPTAEPMFRRLVALRRQALGDDNIDVAAALSELGECLYLENNDSDAEPVLRQALAIERRHGPDPGAETRNYLALLLERKGSYPEAAVLLREAADIGRRTRGADSPEYATSLHNLASALIDAGDLPGAEAKLRETLAIRRKVLGNNHPDLSYTLNNLAFVLLNEGNWSAAEPFAREGLALNSRLLGARHPLVAGSRNGLARILQAKGDFTEAERQFQQALEILAGANQAEGWTAAQIGLNLASLDLDQGKYKEAERLARQSLDAIRKLGGDDTPLVATALIEVAEDRLFQRDPQSALPLLRQALKIRLEKFRPGNAAVVFAETRLGEALIAAGEPAQADPILRQAVAEAHAAEFPLPAWQVAEAESALAAGLNALGRTAEAAKLTQSSSAVLLRDPRHVFRRPATIRLAGLARPARAQ